MKEIFLNISAIVSVVLIGVLALNVIILERKWAKIPMMIKLAAIPSLVILVVTTSYYKKKELPQYSVVRYLEHVEAITPEYVYGYDSYVVEFQGEEIMVNKIQGYSTDSAAVYDKVQVYRQARLPIWGFIKPSFDDEYIFSLKITPDIERGLKQTNQVELKEEK